MKEIAWSMMLLVCLVNVAAAAPVLNYSFPTEADGAYVSRNWTSVNFSVAGQNIDSVKFYWNGTDYGIYDPSLVLDLNFNNNSLLLENSTRNVDSSRYGNNCSCSGSSCPLWTGEGRFAGALVFDGSNDQLTCPSTSSLNYGTGDFTILAWVKHTNTSEAYSEKIVSKKNATTSIGYYLIWNPGTLSFELFINGYTAGPSIKYPLNDGRWHQVSAVFDRDYFAVVYVDGMLIGLHNISKSPYTGSVDAPDALTIGGNMWSGSIDEVRIYRRAFSPRDIWFNFQSEFSRHNSTEYRFFNNLTLVSGDGSTCCGWANNSAGIGKERNYSYYAWANNSAGQTGSTTTRSIVFDAPLGVKLIRSNVSVKHSDYADEFFIMTLPAVSSINFTVQASDDNFTFAPNSIVRASTYSGFLVSTGNWSVTRSGNNYTFAGPLEPDRDNTLIFDLAPELNSTNTGYYARFGTYALETSNNSIFYSNKTSFGFFWHQSLPGNLAKYDKYMVQNGKNEILRLYWWDGTVPGIPNNWTYLYQNATALNTVLGSIYSQIDYAGAGNLSGVTLSEEEPLNGWDWADPLPPHEDHFINVSNVLYRALKARYPALKVYLGVHYDAISPLGLSQMEGDGIVDDIYAVTADLLPNCVYLANWSIQNNKPVYLYQYAATEGSYYNIAPKTIFSNYKACKDAGIKNIGFYGYDYIKRQSMLFADYNYTGSIYDYYEPILHKEAMMALATRYSALYYDPVRNQISLNGTTTVYPNQTHYSERVNLIDMTASPTDGSVGIRVSNYSSTYYKWTANSSSAVNTVYAVCSLDAGRNYDLKIDGIINATYASNALGCLTCAVSGGYGMRILELLQGGMSTTSTTSTTTTTSTSTTMPSTSTSSTTSTTTTTLSITTTTYPTTSTTTTAMRTTTTIVPACIMPGNNYPCNEVTIEEVVSSINKWALDEISIQSIVNLINAWADPAYYHPN